MNQPNTHGGSRPGAGRKKGEETKTVSFRIRPEWEATIKDVVKKVISKLKN